ncbi:hypothetical protein KL949_000889 [Ogataea haglerorum]|nr:hypothetical protein KL950_001449 [Ogataea haglerorum]KAG7721157.1 hypothetical protein KL913_000893 [Ogataea haglerorum]KAG7721911.1 hypothetical protein KL949_000889 [Ogataea haglerorum]KAG7732492.1 hypothetical protein KL948_001922 [Ogataea haglerorum]
MLLLVLILVITLALVAPQLVSNLRDIGTVALEKQASISPTKKPGESAVYRSVDVPHGLPLTTGLRIQTGYQMRDGILKDIWYEALQANTVVEIGGARRSVRQINGMILHLAQQMDQHNVGPRVGLNSCVDDLHALVVLFCCFFLCDRTVVVGEGPNVDLLFTRKTAGSAANVPAQRLHPLQQRAVHRADRRHRVPVFPAQLCFCRRVAADVSVDGVFVDKPRQTACGAGKQEQRPRQDPVRAADGRRTDHRRGQRADRRARQLPADDRFCSERVAAAPGGRAAIVPARAAAQPRRVPQLARHIQPARQAVCHEAAAGVSSGLNFHFGAVQ